MSQDQVKGFVAAGFERVQEQFLEHLRSGEERGAALCVTKDQEIVVNIWGGYQDKAKQQPWQEDTLCLMYSVTKALAATVMMKLHEQGRFTYEMPVSEIWPEFGQAGKEDMTIKTLLSHRGGLPALDDVLCLEEIFEPSKQADLVARLASQKPLWTPGEGQGYHALTYGLYVHELYKRLEEQPFGMFFREHIAEPLGADVWVGVDDTLAPRIAEVEPPSTLKRLAGMLPHIIKGGTTEANVGRSFFKRGSISKRALLAIKSERGGPEAYNLPDVRKHPVLWAGGIGSAQGIARIFGMLANDGQLGDVNIFEEGFLRPVYQREGWSTQDAVLGKPLGWNRGFLKEEVGMFSNNEESFGHSGLGGALGWADPVNRVSIGYITGSLDWRVRSPRCLRLCDAISSCVEG